MTPLHTSVIQGCFRHASPRPVQLSAAVLPPVHGGHPLPAAVRQKMEAVFGTTFHDVRVHVGGQPAAIGAIAFTRGADIHFAPGQYDPATARGLEILGHELAHVVQQRMNRVRNPFGTGVAIVHDHALEAEAQRMSQRVRQMMTAVQPLRVAQPLRRGGVVQRADSSPTSSLQVRFNRFEAKRKRMQQFLNNLGAIVHSDESALDTEANNLFSGMNSRQTGAIAVLRDGTKIAASQGGGASAAVGMGGGYTIGDDVAPANMHAEMILVLWAARHNREGEIAAIGVAGGKGCCRLCSAQLAAEGIGFTKTQTSAYEIQWQDPYDYLNSTSGGNPTWSTGFGGGSGLSAMERQLL